MRETTVINQRKALEAIRANFGRVEPALKSVCLGRTQFYEWLKVDKAFKEAYLQINNEIEIAVSSKLIKKLYADDPQTLIRVTKTMLQKKGVKII